MSGVYIIRSTPFVYEHLARVQRYRRRLVRISISYFPANNHPRDRSIVFSRISFPFLRVPIFQSWSIIIDVMFTSFPHALASSRNAGAVRR